MTFDKNKYWERRKEGKRGTEDSPAPVVHPDPDLKIVFGNQGEMILNNRAYRRRAYRLPKEEVKKTVKRKKRK